MEENAIYSNDIAFELARLHVLHGMEFTKLNMATDYNARLLALQIQKYYEWNPDAGQIMIFKGNKMLVITRRTLADRKFITTFTRLYNK